VLDSLAHGRSGQAESVGEDDLVVQTGTGGDLAGLDQVLKSLRDLDVLRHRTRSVDHARRDQVIHVCSYL
jgi:hypothetical protein